MRTSDAASLCALLTTEEVTRFISPPPTTVEGFKQFIDWTHRQRSAGIYACFAVTLDGNDTAVGLFQIHATEPGFGTAEWGFALGSPFWGTGVFQDVAELVIEFVFETLGTERLEARTAVENGRGNGALLKVGAVQECILRKSFSQNGEYLDQVLYAILQDDYPFFPSVDFGIGKFLAASACGPVSIGLAGSLDHSLHEPGYSFAPPRPACSSASRF
jgi:ribosomal-protein-alanine N-acetyltransferase